MPQISQSLQSTSPKVYRIYNLYTKKPNSASFYSPAMKSVLFFIVGLNLIAIASASEPEEYNALLRWNESVNISGYNIKAVDFRPGTVEEPTNKTKCDYELDTFKRTAWGCDDYVLLQVFKNGNHVLDAPLAARNYTYADGSVFFNETVYEDVDRSLKIIALDVVTGRYIPSPYAVLKIIVKSIGEFDIAKNFTIVKKFPAEAHVNPSFQFISVSIAVDNIGPYDFDYIWVNDSVPEGFMLKTQELGWGISLKKGETWKNDYFIKPIKPVADTEHIMPPAVIYVVRYNKTYSLSTGDHRFILRSSDIIVTKAADKVSGNITVNIGVKNNGSRAALVKVWDSVLPGMEVMVGELDFSIVLQPRESYNNSYILKLNNISGNVSLPYARFDFKEYWPSYDLETKLQAKTGSGISNPVEIEFMSASKQEKDTAAVAPPAGKPSTDDSSIEDSPDESMPSAMLKKASSLWISIQQLPYAVLALLAGGLLAVLIVRIWRPGADKNKDKP